MTAALLQAAIEYAAHGWSVFVLSKSKIPIKNCEDCDPERGYDGHDRDACRCLTCHGFYSATRDQARIIEMCRLHPDACLGVRTGSVSGLAVVDVDISEWDDWGAGFPSKHDVGFQTLTMLDEAGVLPGTVMQSTGSGGLHLLYRHPGGYIKSGGGLVGPKVDSKTDGGYILVSPSTNMRTTTPYRWSGDGRWDYELPVLHDSLTKRLRWTEPEPGNVTHDRVSQFMHGGPRGRLSGLVNTVIDAPAGNRNGALYWAAKKAAALVDEGAMDESTIVSALTDAALTAGLTMNEIGTAAKGSIASGLRNGRAGVPA